MAKPTNLAEALDFDPLDEAGKICGISYKESELTSMYGLALMQENQKLKAQLLAENQDTNGWNQNTEEFFAVLQTLGFVEVLKEELPRGKQFNNEDFKQPDYLYILYCAERGMVVVLDTYWGRKPNAAKVYFNYQYNDSLGKMRAEDHCFHLHKCSGSVLYTGTDEDKDDDRHIVWYGDRDIREGFRYFINEAEQHGKFLTKWLKAPFLWFLGYTDSKFEGYDYAAITRERIAKLPQAVQDTIGPLT